MPVRLKIEQFLRHTRMSPTRFGREVARDPRLVYDMRNGRELGPRMVARIEAFLSTQEPGR
ncbi:hypothetical protein AB2M62_12600 [Sphingomonas sp. MMS12-HWE2-04]|uniref:hypothetical protein n=1 Tax=Sphingomonas sp. MMS12-HWE2-04 TaxID=3234199 RepID=UPI00385173F7